MVKTHKLHDRFRKTWPEYSDKDLKQVCIAVTSLIGWKKKGDCIDLVKNRWGQVCQFLIQWEGEPYHYVPPPKPKPVDINEDPECPDCGIFMVKRQNRSDHSYFWGCKNYPKCRQTKPLLE